VYNTLCIEENKLILTDIENKNYNQAMNRCLFLQSIPVERPQLEPSDCIATDVNNSNYNAAIEKLHELNSNRHSCDCCNT